MAATKGTTMLNRKNRSSKLKRAKRRKREANCLTNGEHILPEDPSFTDMPTIESQNIQMMAHGMPYRSRRVKPHTVVVMTDDALSNQLNPVQQALGQPLQTQSKKKSRQQKMMPIVENYNSRRFTNATHYESSS